MSLLRPATAVQGLVTPGILLTGATALAAVPKIAVYKVALETLGVTSADLKRGFTGLRSVLGPVGVAATLTGVAIQSYEAAVRSGEKSTAELKSALTKAKSEFDALTLSVEDQSTASKVFIGSMADGIKDLAGVLEENSSKTGLWKWLTQDFQDKGIIDRISDIGVALAEIGATDFSAAQQSFRELREEYNLSDETASQMIQAMPEFRDQLLEQADAAGLATDENSLLRLAMQEIGPAAQESTDKASDAAAAYIEQADAALKAAAGLMELLNSLNEANSVGQSAEAANSRYQQTLDEVADAVEQAKAGVEGYSTSMDASTIEGAKNREMMAGLAADSQKAAYALMEQETATLGADKAAENYSSRLADGREKLIAQIETLTGSRDMAIKFADAVYKIPTDHELTLISNAANESNKVRAYQALLDAVSEEELTKLIVDRGNSQAQLDAHIRALNDIPGYRETVINTVVRQTGAPRGQVGAAYNEDGGMYVAGVKYFENGGIEPGTYSGGRTLYGFAEPGVPWETFISGKEPERDRNDRRPGAGSAWTTQHVRLCMCQRM